ncbi:uncharacterized protein KY384_008904 [Bacidia gigantensis]|uniref:uncharacterized protein n=1 Tax=Bacidia gigantensis TaxID=2732470 RepID=UPI001D0424D5|nr:uncharacterized protein KY384_008904 [Bacidia gigantensis]KAG8525260.1 hypothetical protein KY384_008904 [Bacidia gigantensis]
MPKDTFISKLLTLRLQMASILFLGASGQVGGAFLTVFRKAYPDTPITAYLRSTTLDEALTSLGNINIVHGTFEEPDRVEELAATHSIIINCAGSFNPPLTAAILKGMKNTKALTPSDRRPILLHFSGTGNFQPQPRPQDRRELPPNGATDEMILAAAARGDFNALFVCPGGIFGQSADHVGLKTGDASARAAGVWVEWSLKNVQNLGFSPYIGPGTSIIRLVHVDDVVSLAMLVYKRALETWETYKPEDVYSHFYVCVDETVESKVVAEAYAELLVREGKIGEKEARKVGYEEAGTTAYYSAGNTMVEPVRAAELGWKPKNRKKFLETLKESKYFA